MLALALVLACAIGLSLGLLGSGGSIVTLPVLVYVARVPPHQAVGMSLLIVGATSTLGGVLNWRRGDFDLRAASFFAASGILGAFLGSRFTHLVSGRVLLLLFGVLMLLIGAKMLFGREIASGSQDCRPLRCLLVGLAVGVLTGFLGVGGGFVILPALVLFAGLPMKTATGTSLAVIAANSLAGLLGQLRYVQFDWLLTFGFMLASAAGMLIGLSLTRRLDPNLLRRVFAWAVLGLGLFLLVRNAAV